MSSHQRHQTGTHQHIKLGSVIAGGHVTRFIALASVGNPAKAKSLHALALTPAADMDIAVLTQRPDGTTPCPYELPNSSKRALNGQDDDTGGQVRLCPSCQPCFAILPML